MYPHHDLCRWQVLLCHTCLTLACVPDTLRLTVLSLRTSRVGSSDGIQPPLPAHRMHVPMRCVGCVPVLNHCMRVPMRCVGYLPLPGCTRTRTGQYETKAATKTSDRTCGQCDSSQQQYSDGENQKECSDFKFCGEDEKVNAAVCPLSSPIPRPFCQIPFMKNFRLPGVLFANTNVGNDVRSESVG